MAKVKTGPKPTKDYGDSPLDASEGLAAPVITVCFPQTNSDESHRYGAIDGDRRRRRREKEAIRKRVYHQKLKDERNNLKKTVDELSLQLQKLQQSKESTNLGLIDSVWRDLAEEERQKLLNSEAEQKQLLAAAEAKASCINELCKQIPILMDQSLVAPERSGSDVAQFPPNPPFDHTMFRGHLRRVHESYAQIDEIFDVKSMPEGISNSVKRREMTGEVEYFEHRHKFREPFSYNLTQQTLWTLSKLHHRQQDREDFGDVAGSDDILVVRFRLAHTLTSGATVSVLQRYVARRFVEDTRTVIVWKIHSEGEGIFRGMHADQTGCVCLQPSKEEETTEIMVCVRQVPVSFSISSSVDLRNEEFQQVLQNAVNEDMLLVTSKLDQLLLEDTLSGINM